jgi:hypothetical protein
MAAYEQAHTVITFIDELRDQLCEIYGDQFVETRRAGSSDNIVDEQQTELDFDNNSEL